MLLGTAEVVLRGGALRKFVPTVASALPVVASSIGGSNFRHAFSSKTGNDKPEQEYSSTATKPLRSPAWNGDRTEPQVKILGRVKTIEIGPHGPMMGRRHLSSTGASRVLEVTETKFPGALSSKQLAKRLGEILSGRGYDQKKTLLATSLCCDEVNRDLEDDLRAVYGSNFSMGGLAGFAFGGVTSFGAMAHHIPDDGSCVVVYGPHVGIDLYGKVGKVNRRGRDASGACCGSAAAAAAYVKTVQEGEREPLALPENVDDAQQAWVGAQLLPYGERLAKAEDADAELPLALYDAQDGLMMRIIEQACGEVGGNGMICLLGGVQVNTPESVDEFFVPKRFDLRNNKGELVEDLLPLLA